MDDPANKNALLAQHIREGAELSLVRDVDRGVEHARPQALEGAELCDLPPLLAARIQPVPLLRRGERGSPKQEQAAGSLLCQPARHLVADPLQPPGDDVAAVRVQHEMRRAQPPPLC